MSNEHTREWWKERLPLIQAWAEGKKLQFKDGCDWIDDFGTCCFQSPVHMYRIAPKPKLRPWKPEEVPLGAIYKNTGTGTVYHPVSQTAEGSVRVLGCAGTSVVTIEESSQTLYKSYLHSTDGGKTWHPCGVMEEQK